MNYIVLARKYRPQTFAEVYAQEHITEVLQNAILSNRIAHAYLFTGPRGVFPGCTEFYCGNEQLCIY